MTKSNNRGIRYEKYFLLMKVDKSSFACSFPCISFSFPPAGKSKEARLELKSRCITSWFIGRFSISFHLIIQVLCAASPIILLLFSKNDSTQPLFVSGFYLPSYSCNPNLNLRTPSLTRGFHKTIGNELFSSETSLTAPTISNKEMEGCNTICSTTNQCENEEILSEISNKITNDFMMSSATPLETSRTPINTDLGCKNNLKCTSSSIVVVEEDDEKRTKCEEGLKVDSTTRVLSNECNKEEDVEFVPKSEEYQSYEGSGFTKSVHRARKAAMIGTILKRGNDGICNRIFRKRDDIKKDRTRRDIASFSRTMKNKPLRKQRFAGRSFRAIRQIAVAAVAKKVSGENLSRTLSSPSNMNIDLFGGNEEIAVKRNHNATLSSHLIKSPELLHKPNLEDNIVHSIINNIIKDQDTYNENKKKPFNGIILGPQPNKIVKGEILIPPKCDWSEHCDSITSYLRDCMHVRYATPSDDTSIAFLRLSVFSDFDLNLKRKFCSRSCAVLDNRRLNGAVCLVAAVKSSQGSRRWEELKKKSDSDKFGIVDETIDLSSESSLLDSEWVVGSVECSTQEFENTILGSRRPKDKIMYITEVAVSPSARRCGAGTMILKVRNAV